MYQNIIAIYMYSVKMAAEVVLFFQTHDFHALLMLNCCSCIYLTYMVSFWQEHSISLSNSVHAVGASSTSIGTIEWVSLTLLPSTIHRRLAPNLVIWRPVTIKQNDRCLPFQNGNTSVNPSGGFSSMACSQTAT